MGVFEVLVLIFIAFFLGVLFGESDWRFRAQFGGVMNVDDKTNPEKVQLTLELDREFSPEEFSKKRYMIFRVYRNGGTK